jgi:preprotein translocase subunit YajC
LTRHRSGLPLLALVRRCGFDQGCHPVFISQAYAQTAPAPVGTEAGGFQSLLSGPMPFLVLMMVAMYFVVIRPQQKRTKEMKAMLEALAKGDEVVLGGGVIGRVAKMGETFLHVEVANGVELQVQRAAVIQVLPKGTFK